ncbi:hypothetical protein MNBD_GAMMA15-1111 [hydrothermal vent metagenome]|uniref:Uncharacterized protein n=1 Tax=hydrothermal vent metagenome TaxID=652676 RepID=A0A3B0Z9J8_9ZZZZ
MFITKRLMFALLAGLLLIPQAGFGAQRLLLTHENIRVMIDSSKNWCANNVTMNLVASNTAAFSGDSRSLQKLLGGIRATMGFECPQAKRIELIGTVGGVQAYKGYAAASEGWRLRGAPTASSPKPTSDVTQHAAKPRKTITRKKSLPAPTGQFAYLAAFPDVKTVKDSESGSDVDAEARRVAKLIILKSLIETKAGDRLRSNQLTTVESRYVRPYTMEVQKLVSEAQKRFSAKNGDWRKFFDSYNAYAADVGFQMDFLEDYLPAEAAILKQMESARKKEEMSKFLKELKEVVVPILSMFAAGTFVLWVLYRMITVKRRLRKKIMARRKKRNQEALELFGKTREEREITINKVFDRQEDSITYDEKIKKDPGIRKLEFSIYRSLSTMPPRERETLRAAYLLHNAGLMDDHSFDISRLGLIFGDGKCQVQSWEFDFSGNEEVEGKVSSINDAINLLMSWYNISVESIVTQVFSELDQLGKDKADNPTVKSVKKHLKGGHTWFAEEDLEGSMFAPSNGYGLRIGMLDDSEVPLIFSGEGSLISIAPPGSGKTQCNVFPNLLTWKGPAVILDVKGEIYEGTSKWRSENVGPVYKFSPLDPSNSSCYNPLSFIRQEAEFIWEDSRFLADMMIVPSDAKDPFWETKARDVLTAAIAHICYANGPNDRPVSKIIDIMHRIGWDEMVSALKMNVEVNSMVRIGTSLGAMESKTLDSVLQTAQASLSAWDGERINRVTQRSDWSPLDLRKGENPTVYICLKPSEVESYISLLRVFIAQHIRMLTSELPPRDAAPILFMLDELPRLRQMPPVEEALEIGRQYGIRLWMFAQSVGQMQNAYANADGMMGSCAVRIYMNPSLHDGTAQKLSDDIGMREAVLDGTQKKIVEPAELAGPEYRDIQIVMAASSKPVKVRKEFTYQNPELTERMGRL